MDIVERLRQKGERMQIPCPDKIDGCLVYHFQIKTDPDCAEAADKIEQLREEVKAQKLALNHAGDCAFEMLRKDAEIERLRKFIKEHDMAEVLEDWENA